ncbi:glucokinase [Pseudohaliea rubra]|uniref:glucokinase n=1 Tax=Pseudohaliea rubra TaxID=475795 RepID=UPI0013782E87|nr:glucokinase [Pseudohaliea rubra]
MAEHSDGALLVGDIGGTNSRFAIAAGGAGWPLLEHWRELPNDGADGLEDQLRRYLQALPGAAPTAACLAIAGPIRGRRARLTNRPWTIDSTALENALALRRVTLLNDFAALAHALAFLPPAGSTVLQAGAAGARGPLAVLGPGTGLGAALVLQPGEQQQVVPTEAGHADFAPVAPRDWALQQALTATAAPVTAEQVLRGDGIAQLYLALGGGKRTTAAVCAGAGDDPLADEALSWYLQLLGRFAGSLAVTLGATGGVYLAGGVLPRLAGTLPGSGFLDGFNDRGPLADYARAIPVRLVTEPAAAAGGAAIAARHASDRHSAA